MISIREHCVPCSDFLWRLRKVERIPNELESMEEKTAGGIVNKCWKIINSKYFNNLPETAIIKSGAILDYQWSRFEARKEIIEIYNEVKSFLNECSE